MIEYSSAVPIKFLGVWDTVGALGIPFGNTPLSRKSYQFLETDLRINNDFAYHALALDEHRKAFQPTLWTRTIPKNSKPEDVRAPRPLKDVEQRWFVGAHANVGGGYNSDLLAQIPLKWMMDKASLHGLQFRKDVVINGDENRAPVADSYAPFMAGLYRCLSAKYYRPIGLPPTTPDPATITSNINETIDSSIFERWRNDSSYRPPNLVAWGERNKVDIGSLHGSVRADQPTVPV
jgi:hypothetical protein